MFILSAESKMSLLFQPWKALAFKNLLSSCFLTLVSSLLISLYCRPNQKSPVPLNRYEEFGAQAPVSPASTLSRNMPYKMVAKALYNFQVNPKIPS